jgi:hypothetical protein
MLAGVLGVLGVELVLRNVLVPAAATEATVRLAVGVEWVMLAALLAWLVPRIEHGTWHDIGISTFQPRHLWVGAVWFVAASLVSAGVGWASPRQACSRWLICNPGSPATPGRTWRRWP